MGRRGVADLSERRCPRSEQRDQIDKAVIAPRLLVEGARDGRHHQRRSKVAFSIARPISHSRRSAALQWIGQAIASHPHEGHRQHRVYSRGVGRMRAVWFGTARRYLFNNSMVSSRRCGRGGAGLFSVHDDGEPDRGSPSRPAAGERRGPRVVPECPASFSTGR